ncbi:MAG: ORF6N domain-containing protein [Acidobacteriota bacterium]|nr:ORF6N domain-containing protein [Acidobacteriota bacterium]
MPTTRLRPVATETPRILSLRLVTVVVDEDLARLYGVTTRQLNQALKRNRRRFPKDFAFQLTVAECRILKSQSVISSGGHGGRRTRPWAFTEHGAIMAASLLNTPLAIDMSVFVVRAFVRLREWAAPHRALASKLDALEQRVSGHDDELDRILATLRRLIAPPAGPRRAIGFSSPPTRPAARLGAAPRPPRP